MTNFRVDPEALRATRPGFVDVADKIAAAAANLRRVIETEGECWGSDKIGQNFAKDYTPDVPKALSSVENLGKTLNNLGESMVAIANALQNRDQANASQIDQIPT
ncbi:hypothetical protein IU459_22330 [Nocardia amamiensis]|uniref:WXG100 family type VII secretion target n=1 Tax=Nocardia amamiensis TaxID=404578 RepID=A0ABS0CUI6_9NOCA|nr:hypothetical protein [Nocardia amamiensis]MBF6300261.1 hypothetical protein [Nocardia amamiensis]